MKTCFYCLRESLSNLYQLRIHGIKQWALFTQLQLFAPIHISSLDPSSVPGLLIRLCK